MSETYYKGDKGDEVSDYSLNFKLGDTSTVKSTSVFFYADALNRAMSASTTDAMYRSLSYKGNQKPTAADLEFYDATGIILVETDIMSETYYKGDKGDEVSDYSLNFKLGDTSTVKSTSVFFYADALNRAMSASTTDAMYRSLSYKGNQKPTAADLEFYDATGNILVETDIMSETYYKGDKGDEVSDYSLNFKLGDTSTVKSTSVFFYADGLNRAMSASTTDAMYRSLSYKGNQKPTAADLEFYDATGNILVETDIMSETYYKGDKGDEVSDYSLNFKLGDT